MNRPFLKFVTLFCLQIIPFFAGAQNLGLNQGNYLEIASQTGYSSNAFMHKLWLYRKADGGGWTSATLLDGIGIDGSFLTPGVDVRTWWHRDPGDETQSWGSNNQAYLTLNGKKAGVSQSMLEVQSPDKGWVISARTNAFNAGDINGLRFYSGYLGEDKWAGIASVAEDLHSNKTALSFYAGQTEKMRLAWNGNLGIGTVNPRAVLDISNYTLNGMLSAVLGRLPEGDDVGNGTFVGAQGFNTDVIGGKSFSIVHNFYGQTNSSINFHRGGDRTGGFISFNTFSNQERMRIDPNGNVGIGTTTPREKLSVNGNIRAHEIKVEATNWPDYVFEEGYNVGTLSGLESYIRANKHLPEIPSAKEVEANGVELGEMNKLLLKKIEELTLYVIELKKESIEQQKQLDQLKKR